MKRILCALLAAAMLASLTACKTDSQGPSNTVVVSSVVDSKVSGDSYVGQWQDLISKRATMEIKGAEGGKYEITVSWGGSAFETVQWVMNASLSDNGELVYTGGAKQTLKFSEDGEEKTEVEYSDSKGSFKFYDNRIVWTDDKDVETSESRVFVKDADNLPDDLKMLGFYSNEDGSTLDITYNYKDGLKIDMSIVRLAQFEGTAAYDAGSATLVANVTDPNGQPMTFNIIRNDNKAIATVENSTWELLKNGETIEFEM